LPCNIQASTRNSDFGKVLFVPSLWTPNDSKEHHYTNHEIILSKSILSADESELHATLVYGMILLWQHDFGKPGKNAYLNAEWASKMEQLGLMPSHNSLPGGDRTGYNIGYYVLPTGKFRSAFESIKNLKPLPYKLENTYSTQRNKIGKDLKPSRSGKRLKYSCKCGNNVRGKAGLNIICGDCQSEFVPEVV
jgi:hypothetical protein